MVWQKGQSGNPSGKHRKLEIELIRQAIAETSREKKKSLWKHLIERCYEEDAVLIAVAKKFMPDSIRLEGADGKNFILKVVAFSAEQNMQLENSEIKKIECEVIKDKKSLE